jgi:hypothetical protein
MLTKDKDCRQRLIFWLLCRHGRQPQRLLTAIANCKFQTEIAKLQTTDRDYRQQTGNLAKDVRFDCYADRADKR